MVNERKFLVDVGIKDIPFPIRVISKNDPEDQHTIANITVTARIMRAFEARWIDNFIKILHHHRERLSLKTLKIIIDEYLEEFKAEKVRMDFEYPVFIEKITPVSEERCLVKYMCTHSAEAYSGKDEPVVTFRMEVPCITTYPGAIPERPEGLFGQLSTVAVTVKSRKEVFPEDIVKIVDTHALAPVYSFLNDEDQIFIIQKVHSETKSSVVMIDEIKDTLAHLKDIDWYSVRCYNYAMLHSYSTIIGTEKCHPVTQSGIEKTREV